jgi:hypothetical protein
MKKSNVSFENLLDQLSEEKINMVVDRKALRAGWLDSLGVGGGGDTAASGTGSNSGSGSGSGKSGSTANNNTSPFGICI